MKKTITFLGALLVLQLLVAAGLYTGRDRYGTFVPEEKLLAFDKEAVDGLRITDGEGESLEIRRAGGVWSLPALGDFPAAESTVTGIIDKAAGFEKGWPVATTPGAAERFRVAGDNFERRLELLQGDERKAVLFVGTSPGLRKVHVGTPGDDTVYAVEFGTHELALDAASWIDREFLRLDQAAITAIALPEVTLERQGDLLSPTNLAEAEEAVPEEVERLASAVANFRIRSILDGDDASAFAFDAPDFLFTVKLGDGTEREYRFSKPEGKTEYGLQTTVRDEIFAVETWAVDRIRETTRDKLVRAKEAAPAGEEAVAP